MDAPSSDPYADVDPAVLAEMRRAFEEAPLHKLLGLQMDSDLPPGRCTVTIPLGPGAMSSTGNLHGGAIGVICDVACASAAARASTYVPTEVALVTADLHVRYLARPRGDTVRAEAQVVKAGRTLIVVQAEVKDGEDNVIAVADFSAMLVPFRKPLALDG